MTQDEFPLFHVYVGRKYLGPQRAKNEEHATIVYARKNNVSRLILRAEPAPTIQQCKAKKAA